MNATITLTDEDLNRAMQRTPDPKQPEAPAVQEHTYRVAADELRRFIKRYERLEAEKKDLVDQQKEVWAEAKGRGYDTKVMRKIIALRKRDAADVAEEESVLALYKSALGM